MKITPAKKGGFLIVTETGKFSISSEAYTEMPLYEGKELSVLEKRNLLHLSGLSAPLHYAEGLLTKREYSVSELKKKVLLKFPEFSDINELVYSLKQACLLDDERFAKDYAEAKDSVGYGEKRIKEDLLYKKGVSPEIVDHLEFPHEERKAFALVAALSKRYSSLPLRKAQEKAYILLLNKGYEEPIASKASSKIEVDSKLGEERLRKEASLINKRLERKYNGYDLNSHLYASLMRKGYSSSDISTVIKELHNEKNS